LELCVHKIYTLFLKRIEELKGLEYKMNIYNPINKDLPLILSKIKNLKLHFLQIYQPKNQNCRKSIVLIKKGNKAN
jgi:hypothetical protein